MSKVKISLRVFLCFIVACAIFGGAGQAAEDDIVLNLEYSDEDLVLSKINGYDLLELNVDKASLMGKPGEPWIPICYVNVLIPLDKEVDTIQSTVLLEKKYEEELYLHPAQPDFPTTEQNPQFYQPDPVAYSKETPIPEKVTEYKKSGSMRGYNMLALQVNPITYIPKTREISIRKQIQIVITLKTKGNGSGINTEEILFKDMVKSEVVNPEMAENYFGSGTKSGSYPYIKYLIICSPNMAASQVFEDFMYWKTKKGLKADLKDTQWISQNYEGEDLQAKIRECIKDYLYNWLTVWVLIVGDNPDTIRYCYARYNPDDQNNFITSMPTDLYYAELDSDWDPQDDGIYGAIYDDNDLWPEVIVGRLPTENPQEALAYLNKALDYEKNMPAGDFAEKMLLSGNTIWNYGDAEGKSEYMYQGRVGVPDDNGWIQPYWNGTRYRFYDTATDFSGGASYQVNVANLNQQIDNGYNFLHMACHGGTDCWVIEGENYYADDVLALTNFNKYTNILTMACNTNGFDVSDYEPCLGEAFIRKAYAGAVSYIGCARDNWGAFWSVWEHGAGFKYNREFYHHLFTTDWGGWLGHHYHVGAVYTRMKIYWISECYTYTLSMRWVQYGLNLLGDPELPLYIQNPANLSPLYQSSIYKGLQTFVVETGVGKVQVCLWKGDEVYVVGKSNSSGHFEAEIDPLTTGDMMVTCTKPNYYPHEGEVTVLVSGDDCSDAQVLNNGNQVNYTEILRYATRSPEPAPPCASMTQDSVDIWYKISPGLEQLVTVTMTADELESGFIVYSGDCNNLTLVDCKPITYYLVDHTLQFVTDDIVEMDYYIRLYGYDGMGGTLSVEWEPAPVGKFCQNPHPAQCENIFNEYNPITGVGSDELPCMSGYPGDYEARWLGIDVPPETILNIDVEGFDPSDPVGAGFYQACGDLSSPINSSCGTGLVFFCWDNPSQDFLPLKILVNSPLGGGHPEISLFCMPYH